MRPNKNYAGTVSLQSIIRKKENKEEMEETESTFCFNRATYVDNSISGYATHALRNLIFVPRVDLKDLLENGICATCREVLFQMSCESIACNL